MDIVRRWMSSPAIVVRATTSLPEARSQMRERRIRRLPVVDGAGQLVGIVTEGDINRVSDSPATDVRDYNLYHRAGDLPIGDIMTQAVVTVAADTPILEVARLLLEHRIGGVPVVEDGRVVGVITESDLFRLIVARGTQDAQPPAQ
jgi:CBS domain-containing protein